MLSKNAPVPQNVSELRSFLGMVQYYHPFLPDLATTLAPLHELLKKGVQWTWMRECQQAYKACKNSLTSDALLVHYDGKRELRLACDGRWPGKDNEFKQEALSIVFGVKKFHQFSYEHKFTLITDHKPLLAIFSPKSAIPTLAAARMQRWALVLSAYDYEIEYKRSEDHANCDALSRLPHEDSTVGSEGAVYSVSAIDDDFPITAEDIGKATLVDPVLSKVHQFVMSGWPEGCLDETFKPYHNRRNELSCEQDCVLWAPGSLFHQSFEPKCWISSIGNTLVYVVAKNGPRN